MEMPLHPKPHFRHKAIFLYIIHMNHSDIPKLRALREEYIRKYNANYKCCWVWGANDPDQPTPTYNPTFWDRLCLPFKIARLYKKYDLNIDTHYDTDKLIQHCNSAQFISIDKINAKYDTILLIYHNENKRLISCYKSKRTSKTLNAIYLNALMAQKGKGGCHMGPQLVQFEDYVAYLKDTDILLRKDIYGIKSRRETLYKLIISSIDIMIHDCINILPLASQQAIAQPM